MGALLQMFQYWQYLLFGIYFSFATGSSGINVGKYSNIEVKDHTTVLDGNSVDGITEIVWGQIKDVYCKSSLRVSPKPQMLPISVYATVYKNYKDVIVRQRATRISNIKFAWTPLTKSFRNQATIMVYDQRWLNSKTTKLSIKKFEKFDETTTMGDLVAIKSFDPNIAQLIHGSLDFATATSDIDKIKFFIHFNEDMEPGSVAGFLDVGWRTQPDDNGVHQKIIWETLQLPLVEAPEIKLKSGKNFFEKMQNLIEARYNSEISLRQKLDDIAFNFNFASDGGKEKLKGQIKDQLITLGSLANSAQDHIDAINLREKLKKVSGLQTELRAAIASGDQERITLAIDKIKEEEPDMELKDLQLGKESGEVQMNIGAASW